MHACTAHVLASTVHAPHTTGMNYACTTPTALILALALSMKPQKTRFVVHQAKSGAVVHKKERAQGRRPGPSITLTFPAGNWQPFPLREPVNVPRQGTGKRPRQGLASVPRQGTGKRPRQGLQTFPERELATVPRQGIGKRTQAWYQQASQAGTGKRSQAGNWQAYPGRVLASVPGRDYKRSQAGNCRCPRAGDSGCSPAGNRRH